MAHSEPCNHEQNQEEAVSYVGENHGLSRLSLAGPSSISHSGSAGFTQQQQQPLVSPFAMSQYQQQPVPREHRASGAWSRLADPELSSSMTLSRRVDTVQDDKALCAC